MNKRIKYPDGQISSVLDYSTGSWIKERINSYEDLYYVRGLAEVLNANGVRPIIYIPCLFGQRSDRRFDGNQSFDLKIICETINACNAEKVIIFDPHSNAPLLMINNAEKESPFRIISGIVSDWHKDNL